VVKKDSFGLAIVGPYVSLYLAMLVLLFYYGNILYVHNQLDDIHVTSLSLR